MKKITKKQEIENTFKLLDEIKEEIKELLISLPSPVMFKRETTKRADDELYNIHKRSIPISIDKPVVVGVTKEEGEKEVKRLVEREVKRRNSTNENIFFIFDLVPVKATPAERSIFYNEGSPVL